MYSFASAAMLKMHSCAFGWFGWGVAFASGRIANCLKAKHRMEIKILEYKERVGRKMVQPTHSESEAKLLPASDSDIVL